MVLTIENKGIKSLKKFEIKCLDCGSTNVDIEIDWAAYPSASWNNTTFICKDCHTDEVIYESD
jgi:ribosomal protein S27E